MTRVLEHTTISRPRAPLTFPGECHTRELGFGEGRSGPGWIGKRCTVRYFEEDSLPAAITHTVGGEGDGRKAGWASSTH
jgi:hypothetical protein